MSTCCAKLCDSAWRGQCRFLTSSGRSCDPLVRVSHRAWSGNVGGGQLRNLKPGLLDHLVDPTIQVATASDALPEWCESILSHRDARVGRAAMLYKDELTASLQDALHLLERPLRVRNRTQRPRQDNRIDTCIRQR
jgi:hypothetical protein